MKILIRGGNFTNKGDEGMMHTMQHELGRRLPGASMWIRASPSQADLARDFGIHPDVSPGRNISGILQLCRRVLSKPGLIPYLRLGSRAALEVAFVDRVDAVVDMSGFGYSDVWGTGFCERGMSVAEYARRQGKNHVCMPQAWGPFEKPPVAAAVRNLIRSTRLAFTRDSVSDTFLGRIMGEEGRGKIFRSPDMALGFVGHNPESGLARLRAMGIDPKSQAVVALTPNMRVYERVTGGEGAANPYVQALVRVAQHFIRKHKAAIVLLSHEQHLGVPGGLDDRYLCGLLQSILLKEGTVVSASHLNLAHELRSIYPHLDLVVGSRFHSMVFSLGAGTPVVALGWAHKYGELLDEFGLRDFSINYQDIADTTLIPILDRAWSERKSNRELVSNRLGPIHSKLNAMFDQAAASLGGQQ